ncbi:MAG: ATP-binding protein [Campylobacterales bacterium]
MLLNLFNNAKDAILSNSNTRGKIVCVFEKSANLGVIKISDNGGGIKDELLPEKLFEPHVSTKGEGGTGTDLYICKTIIEKSMNRSIKARNTQNGSEFTIELPLSESRVRASLL